MGATICAVHERLWHAATMTSSLRRHGGCSIWSTGVYERTFQRPIRPSEGPMTTTARAVRQAPAASPAP